MPHAVVENLIAERDRLLNTTHVLKNNAADTGNDPSSTDLEVMERSFKRIDEIDHIIKVIGEDRAMDEDTRQRLLAPTPDTHPGGIKYRSGGEMMWDCLHANFGSAP